jgi:hypothetical protein
MSPLILPNILRALWAVSEKGGSGGDRVRSPAGRPTQGSKLKGDEEGIEKILPDESAQSIGGFLNTTTQKYSFVITRYIQSVLTGEINSQGLYILGGTTGVSAKRIVAYGPEYNPSLPSENTRLIVTFAQ